MERIESFKNWILCHPYASLVPALEEGLITFVDYCHLASYRELCIQRHRQNRSVSVDKPLYACVRNGLGHSALNHKNNIQLSLEL